MNIACPHCHSLIARKNGSTPNGKQKFQCIFCLKQFVEDPQNKIIPQDTKEKIRRSLIYRKSFSRGYLSNFRCEHALATRIYAADFCNIT